MALIAVGCFGISLWMHEKPYQNHFDAILFAYAAFSRTCLAWIGAAVGLLYSNWRAGALIGIVVEAVAVVAYTFSVMPWT
jgi:hypothetical protein